MILKNKLVIAGVAAGVLLASFTYRKVNASTEFSKPKAFVLSIAPDLNYAQPFRIKVLPGHGPYNRTLNFGTHDKDADECQFTLLAADALVEASRKYPGFEVENLKTLTQYTQKIRSFMTGDAFAGLRKKYPYAILKFDSIPQDTAAYIKRLRTMRNIAKSVPINNQDLVWTREREYCDALGDLEIILHMDMIESSVHKGFYADSGFSISLNPANENFDTSIAIAESISTHLSRVMNVSTAPYFATLPKFHKNDRLLLDIGKYGIRLRDDLPQLGKATSRAQKPTLLLEIEQFPKRYRLQQHVHEISDMILQGIDSYRKR